MGSFITSEKAKVTLNLDLKLDKFDSSGLNEVQKVGRSQTDTDDG